jgi:4-amino-4-deoxy-L-arabinose transferase-like glycosyltransferase
MIIFGFILFYLATRLIRLDQFPIFTDEGIYIRWAKIAWHDASWRFISLTDGKQPLQTWATIPFLKLFPNNLLLAGRLFSVTTGFISLIGIFCLLFYLFNKKTAFIGSFLYILTPYFLFYDRMALTDSAVNTGFIWILFFSIVLIKTLQLDVALIFGLVAGLALLTKSSAQMFVALSFLAPIILIVSSGLKKNFKRIVNFIFLYVVVLALSFSIYNIQRLSPFIHYIGTKNTTFLMTFDEFIKAPFSCF